MSDKLNEAIGRIGESVEGFGERIARVEKVTSETSQNTVEKIEELGGRINAVEENVRSRNHVSLPGVEDEAFGVKKRWSWARALRGIAYDEWGDGFEKEIFAETSKKRALNQGTDSAGGYLVPTEFMPNLIEKLVAQSTVLKAGATLMDGLSGGSIQIPKELAVASVAAKTETAQLTETDPTFAQLTLAEKHAGAITHVSRTLLRNSSLSVDDFIERQLLGAAQRRIDLKALKGDGTGNDPTGVFNDTGTILNAANDLDTYGGTNRVAGKQVGFNELNDVIGAIESNDAWIDGGRAGAIWHPGVKRGLMEQRVGGSTTTDGPYVVPPVASNTALQNVMGFPHYGTTQLQAPTSANTGEYIVSGDWSQLIVAMWGGMEIEASDQFKFDYNQVSFRLVFSYDIGVRQPKAFCKGTTVGLTAI